MALIDVYNIRYEYPNLRNRVLAQIAKSAQNVLSENVGYPNHKIRVPWAQLALNSPKQECDKLMWYIASNVSALGHASPDDTTDTEIQVIVDTYIDILAKMLVSETETEVVTGISISDTYKSPKELLIYYGYMNSFNSGKNAWTNELVAQDMAKYDIIVLGDGIQNTGHPDYANTQIIIPRVKALNPSVAFFGYVTANQVIANFQTKVDEWNTLEVRGIFIDEAGYDFGIDRGEFNQRVQYVHSKSNSNIIFANAWNPDNILGLVEDASFPNSTFNPNLYESLLIAEDYILLESNAVNTSAFSATNGYEPHSQWFDRCQKAINLRKLYGCNIAGIGVINNTSTFAQALANFGFTSALMWSLDSWGTSDVNYGSSSAMVNYWPRQETSFYKDLWSIDPAVKVDLANSVIYHRYTTHAKLTLDFTASNQTWYIKNENLSKIVIYSNSTASTATGAGFQTLKSAIIPSCFLANGRLIRVQAGVRRTTGTGNGTYRLTWDGSTIVSLAAIGTTPIILNGHIYLTSGNVNGYFWHDAARAYASGGALVTNKDQALALVVDLATDTDVFTCDWMTVEILT